MDPVSIGFGFILFLALGLIGLFIFNKNKNDNNSKSDTQNSKCPECPSCLDIKTECPEEANEKTCAKIGPFPKDVVFEVGEGVIWNTEDAFRKCPDICRRAHPESFWTREFYHDQPGYYSKCKCKINFRGQIKFPHVYGYDRF